MGGRGASSSSSGGGLFKKYANNYMTNYYKKLYSKKGNIIPNDMQTKVLKENKHYYITHHGNHGRYELYQKDAFGSDTLLMWSSKNESLINEAWTKHNNNKSYKVR